jgi:hypothetical protein
MRSIARLWRCLAGMCLLSLARPGVAQTPPNDLLGGGFPRAGAPVMALLRPVTLLPLAMDTPVVRRPRAIEYSDAYNTRLTIHRYGSYAMIPLFIAEYSLGENLMNDASPASWMKPAHGLVAGGVAVLFGLNTITGVWNLWESRSDPAGRTRRIVHSVMMIAADAGFAATGATAPEREHSLTSFNDYQHRVNVHRGLAIGSIALSTIGGGMMWFWKQ